MESAKKKRLGLLLRNDNDAPKVPLASLTQLGYKPPNSDGSRKSCSNCPAWNSGELVCRLHDDTETITEKMICNHHVFGVAGSMESVSVTDALTPKTSGLQLAGSCNDCKWYKSTSKRDGECLAANDDSGVSHPIVMPNGVCNRFEE